MLLETKQCGIRFGGVQALKDFCLHVETGGLVGIIGPNGAGKTTLFNLLTGIYRPTTGDLLLEGRSLVKRKSFQINRAGVARTFQNIRLFSGLSVEDNVLIAFHHEIRSTLFSAILKSRRYLEEEGDLRKRSAEMLEVFGLRDKKDELADNLSYGDQRRLEIVRALATRPRLLLLDEPAAGMNATEKNHLVELIRFVHEKYRPAILLIEHDMGVVMTLCPKIIVLDYGEIIAEGSPEEIRRNPKVIEAYLGKADDSSN